MMENKINQQLVKKLHQVLKESSTDEAEQIGALTQLLLISLSTHEETIKDEVINYINTAYTLYNKTFELYVKREQDGK